MPGIITEWYGRGRREYCLRTKKSGWKDLVQTMRISHAFLHGTLKQADISETRTILNNLGYLNYRMDNYVSSSKFYRELLRLSADEDFWRGTAYYGLALTDVGLEKPDKALRNADKAVSILDKPDFRLDFGIALRVLGDVRRYRKEQVIAGITLQADYGKQEGGSIYAKKIPLKDWVNAR